MQIKAGHNCEELAKMTFLEVLVNCALDLGFESINRASPNVMSLLVKAQVQLELLKQPHKMVQVVGQRKV